MVTITSAETATPSLAPPRLRLRGITKHYGGVAALTDVALTVRPGEVHALLGENGAGKSTLINVASGTTAPDAGTIEVDGTAIDHLTPRSRWRWASRSYTSTRRSCRT